MQYLIVNANATARFLLPLTNDFVPISLVIGLINILIKVNTSVCLIFIDSSFISPELILVLN
jgi:hypothetical protein